jgi:hypothetical protein
VQILAGGPQVTATKASIPCPKTEEEISASSEEQDQQGYQK